ncbi:unnamed protein product [Spirodela intermedia]|uniref:Uncharacterized protein n=1 Tax=Spirodela intermedia TaxID=51605 RepID=A0A7I8L588_SPIIN|nr:unnamed protein product [Spirodela intermedia]
MATVAMALHPTARWTSSANRRNPKRERYSLRQHDAASRSKREWGEEKSPVEKLLAVGADGRPKVLDDEKIESLGVADFVERSRALVGGGSGGPPRWFSPVECRWRGELSPLLMFLPGIDGIGLGLLRHHQRLGKIFDIWCLHIPPTDRTPFEGLVNIIEDTVKMQISCFPKRPIYLVGETLGACLALSLASRNPDIDFILILGNPATHFHKSPLQSLSSLMELLPEFLVDILTRDSLKWRLKLLRSASLYANSRVHSVRVETLILASGKDQLLPSRDEAEKLCRLMSNCRIRHFKDCGHNIFLESGVDLVTVIKRACFYRRSRQKDHISDYLLPTDLEFKNILKENRWLTDSVSPVMLSTLSDGKIVKNLSGIPSEGPAIFVGNHMLMGWDLVPLVSRLLSDRGIHLRTIAHPIIFDRFSEIMMPDYSSFDHYRLMGAVPASAMNLYKLLSSRSFVLLFPGGAREALHRKGEEYKLFWPEQPEFIRMAAKFGATIVPFGVIGEDDICKLLLDYDDLVKIPFFYEIIKRINHEAVRLRADSPGDARSQNIHLPGLLPKIPGRFYFLFGRPIQTRGRREDELMDKENARELYYHVKCEVESSIAYLKDKREKDPYRNLLPRLLYQATHGFSSTVPTFDL